MPAAFAAAFKLVVDVVKNSMAGSSSNEGELDTSTTTSALVRASARPSPVSVLTPVLGEAATTSSPWSLSLSTTFDPRTPVPPITTIFMGVPLKDACGCTTLGVKSLIAATQVHQTWGLSIARKLGAWGPRPQ